MGFAPGRPVLVSTASPAWIGVGIGLPCLGILFSVWGIRFGRRGARVEKAQREAVAFF